MRCDNSRMPLYSMSTRRSQRLRASCQIPETACRHSFQTQNLLLTMTRAKASTSTQPSVRQHFFDNHACVSPTPRESRISLSSHATASALSAHKETQARARAPSNNLGTNPFLDSVFLEYLQPEDITYLCSKGSFSIPEREYAETFIEEYFKRIHPIVPVLEEVKLCNAFNHATDRTISLFVFQALLFASCPVSSGDPSGGARRLTDRISVRAPGNFTSMRLQRQAGRAEAAIHSSHGELTWIVAYREIKGILSVLKVVVRSGGRDKAVCKNAGCPSAYPSHIGRSTPSRQPVVDPSHRERHVD